MPVTIFKMWTVGSIANDSWAPGYGSNLTFDGTVECDAAIMDGATGDFGSVGAVSGNCIAPPVHYIPWTCYLFI